MTTSSRPDLPPHAPMRHVPVANNGPDLEAVVVIARSTQEAMVENLPSLRG